MKKLFKNQKKVKFFIALLGLVCFTQALVIAKLYTEKDDKNYDVNLVKINTVKDSIDHQKLKEDLKLVDNTVRQLNSFLGAKNIENEKIEALKSDSLTNAVYLAKQSNRYSQYLVNLQNRLQQVPLGIPTTGNVSSNFGIRKNPIPPKPEILLASVKPAKPTDSSAVASTDKTKNGSDAVPMQFHKGIDIGVAYGSDVFAAAAGKIIFAGVKGGYGNCVIVSHANGLATLYAHLSQVLVKSNDVVKVGDVIAKSGNTGRSTGPHLHYEVHKNNQPVNPKLFMNL